MGGRGGGGEEAAEAAAGTSVLAVAAAMPASSTWLPRPSRRRSARNMAATTAAVAAAAAAVTAAASAPAEAAAAVAPVAAEAAAAAMRGVETHRRRVAGGEVDGVTACPIAVLVPAPQPAARLRHTGDARADLSRTTPSVPSAGVAAMPGGGSSIAAGNSTRQGGMHRGGGMAASGNGGNAGVAAGSQAAAQRQQRSPGGVFTARTGPPPPSLRPHAPWTQRPAAGDPVGADGRRPLLSSTWAGVAARRPTQTQHAAAAGNTPTNLGGGISAVPAGGGQVATNSGGAATAVAGPRGSGPGAQQPRSIIGGDGFTLVQSKAAAKAAAKAAQDGAACGANDQLDVAAGVPTTPSGGGGAEPTPAGSEDNNGPGGDDGMGSLEGETGGGDAGPTADDLHACYTRDQKLVSWMLDQGYQADDPALLDAKQRAAASEQAWKGTLPGVRVSRRLVGAEEALTRAKKAQAKQEQALDELDRWYEHEREAQVAWLSELRSRTRLREAKLAEIATLAADEFGAARDEDSSGALGEAVDVIESDLGPVVRDLIAAAPEGSDIRAKLSGLMGTITTVYNIVTHESRGRWADTCDIGGGDEEQADCNDGWGHQWHDHESQSHAQYRWYGYDPWQDSRATKGGAAAEQQYTQMDTGDVQVPWWMREDANHNRWEARAGKRGRREGYDAWGTQGRHLDGDEPNDDHERAAVLQAQFQDAAAEAAALAAAQAAASTAASPTTSALADEASAAEAAAAAEQLEARRRAIWDQAQEEGAEVSAEAIASMDAADLEEWAQAHLV